MSIEIEGLRELEAKLNKVLSESDTINHKALNDVALDLLGKSIELAPIDKGDLRGSGSAKINDNEAIVGFSEPYAVVQHEHTEYSHPRGGEAKYLEKPFRENINKYIKHIADANESVFK